MQSSPSECNKIFPCRLCDRWFSTSKGLGIHMNVHERDQEWERKRKEVERELHLQSKLCQSFKGKGTGLYPSFNSGLTDINMTVVPRMTPTRFFSGNTFTNGSSSGGLGPVPPYNNNLYPQRNVFKEEDVTLKLGNDNIVEIDDDDDPDKREEGTPKSWGADLSL